MSSFFAFPLASRQRAQLGECGVAVIASHCLALGQQVVQFARAKSPLVAACSRYASRPRRHPPVEYPSLRIRSSTRFCSSGLGMIVMASPIPDHTAPVALSSASPAAGRPSGTLLRRLLLLRATTRVMLRGPGRG
jgi:hypothetical protein